MMKRPTVKTLVLSLAALALTGAGALADPVRVVAAENFYGDLARQIGGEHVAVVSILTNPDQDPHLFEASPQTAKAVAGAQVVIVNGADYDPWMNRLLAASPAPARKTIDVGALVGAKPGDNPHLWYGPQNMKAAAQALAEALAAVDAPHAADYRSGAAQFLVSLKPLDARLADMRQRYQGVAVAASEPVFGCAAEAAGLDVREGKFALSVMNDSEPAPSDVATFESDLKGHKVRALIYNSQASEPSVEKLVALARASGVPVVGVTETEPARTSYQQWIEGELDALDHALGAPVN
jgi:zinc/manganese transport system substrate-binding protein